MCLLNMSGFFSGFSLPSLNISRKLRRLSGNASFTSNAPPPARTRGRRTAFAAVHFKKEKVQKDLETAISNCDVTMVNEVMAIVDISEIEEAHVSYVKMACKKGDLNVIDCLIRNGANVNAFGEDNYSALHYCARNGLLDIIHILLHHGTNINLRTKYEKKTALHLAIRAGFHDVAELLLANGADINQTDLYGGHVLHVACRLGHDSLLPILFHHRTEINSYDNEGWTGLHLAAEAGHVKVVRYLIENHANVDAQSRYGRTPLHWACAAGHVSTVNELLVGNANANIRDLHNKLPIDYASNETIRTLVKIYTNKPDVVQNSVSTIGLHIIIDPRRKDEYEREFRHAREAKSKRWLSVTSLQEPTLASVLSKEELADIEQRHRRRESKMMSSLPDNLNGLANKLPQPEKMVEQTFENLTTQVNSKITRLTDSFKDFYSVMALAQDANVQMNPNTINGAIHKLSSVQDILDELRSDFQTRSAEFLTVVNDEQEKTVSSGGAPSYIALCAIFTEALLKVLGECEDQEIWIPFLDSLRIPEPEVQDLLKIRLKMDSTLTLTSRLRHCIQFWARSCEEEHDDFMRTLFRSVMSLKIADFSSSDELIMNILREFVGLDMRFRTGSRLDKMANLSKIIAALHLEEILGLIQDLEENKCNFSLISSHSSISTSFSNELDIERDIRSDILRRRQECKRHGDKLYQVLKDILVTEDSKQMLKLVKSVILIGREDLLPLML